MSQPTEYEFQLYKLFNGGLPLDHKIPIGYLPSEVAWAMRWPSVPIMLSARDVQKIRFHQQHGMPDVQASIVMTTVSDGDYYTHNRGGELQVEVVYHAPQREREIHFAVLAMDKTLRGMHLRTFFRTTNLSRSKFKGGSRLRWVSGVDYFKGLV